MTEDCVFCKIVKGEIPCHKVWENEDFLAFLDINPAGIGHTLVIPKRHFRWVWEVEDFGEYFEAVRKVALLLKEKLGARWVKMMVIGIDVPHAHVHLIPQETEKKIEMRELGEVEEIIKG